MFEKIAIVLVLASIYGLYIGATAAAIGGIIAAVVFYIAGKSSSEKGNLWSEGPEDSKDEKKDENTF